MEHKHQGKPYRGAKEYGDGGGQTYGKGDFLPKDVENEGGHDEEGT